MPISKLSVGRDKTITVFLPLLGVLPLDVVTSFDIKPVYTDLKSKGLDGVVRHGSEPDGWTGTIGIDRANTVVDDICAQLETAYFAGQNIDQGQITETTQEPNGTISQYRVTGVSLVIEDAGAWQNGKFIAQKLKFNASRRLKIV